MIQPICICGSEKFSVIREGNYSFFTVQGKPVPFQALKCLSCGMVLTNPPPSRGFSYDNELDSGQEIEEDDLYYTQSSLYRIRRLKPYLNYHTKILEIGCHTGKLVEMATSLGVQESIGIEIFNKTATYGRNLGRDIRSTQLHECNFPSNYFDVIQAHHVLEHIPNLPQIIDEIYRIIKPNGIFYVTVPRHNSVFVRSENWMGWFPQEHFWHFTEKSLIKLLNQHGFTLSRFCCPLHSEVLAPRNNLDWVKKIAKLAIKKANMGDTVEAWFIKKPLN